MWRAGDLDPVDGTKTEQVEALVLRRIERGDLSIGSQAALGAGAGRATRAQPRDRRTGAGSLAGGRRTGDQARLRDASSGRSTGCWTRSRPASTVTAGDQPVLDLRFATTAAPHDVAEVAAQIVAGRPAAGHGRRRSAAGWVARAPYGASRAADHGGRTDRAGPADADRRCSSRSERRTGRSGPRTGRSDHRDPDVPGCLRPAPQTPPGRGRLAGRRLGHRSAHPPLPTAPAQGHLPAGGQPQPDRPQPSG